MYFVCTKTYAKNDIKLDIIHLLSLDTFAPAKKRANFNQSFFFLKIKTEWIVWNWLKFAYETHLFRKQMTIVTKHITCTKPRAKKYVRRISAFEPFTRLITQNENESEVVK